MIKFFRFKKVVIVSKAWQSLKFELETNRLPHRSAPRNDIIL
jgi:hypothetical protein